MSLNEGGEPSCKGKWRRRGRMQSICDTDLWSHPVLGVLWKLHPEGELILVLSEDLLPGGKCWKVKWPL